MLVSFIAAYPGIWAIGFGFVFWPILAVVSFVTLRNREPNSVSKALLVVGLSELFSIPLGVLFFDASFQRVLAALVNISVWVTSSILISAKLSSNEQIRLTKTLINIALIQAGLVLIARIIFPNSLPIPIFREQIKSFGKNAFAFADNQIVYIDWLDGFTFRSSGVMANATWAGGFSVLAIFLLWRRQIELKKPVYRYSFEYLLLGYVAYISLSRSVMVSALIALFCTLVFRLIIDRNYSINIAAAVISVIVISILAFFVYTSSALQELIFALNQTRSGSFLSRRAIYDITVNYLKEHPFPVLGFGIKPEGEGLVASIATHSTFLGVLFKGGILGFLAYISFLLVSFKQLAQIRSTFGILLFTFIASWTVLEDFDGGHLLPLFLALIFHTQFARGYEITSAK
jgi:O-antigen ligase